MIDINKFEKLADEIISNVKKDEMKTPLQELQDWVNTELKLDGYEHKVISDKIETLFKKEYMVIMDAHYAPKYGCFSEDYYNKTFNPKEK